jgi:predicted DNA-binding transcriptional regulator AlpA
MKPIPFAKVYGPTGKLKISRAHLYRLMLSPSFPPSFTLMENGRRFFDEDELDNWLATQRALSGGTGSGKAAA